MTIDVLITGANRGIGLEFVGQYLAAGKQVMATCRDPAAASELTALQESHPGKLEIVKLDVTDEGSVAALAAGLNDRAIDLLINNAGVYGPSGAALQSLDAGAWLQVFATNSIAPVQLSAALLDNLARAANPKLVVISSKMGSIADNSSGGAWVYRSSKAAVNAAFASLAIDLKERNIAVAVLHPGWVETDMGGPNALIDTATSVAGMRQVIADLKLATSGRFVSYDGSAIPW